MEWIADGSVTSPEGWLAGAAETGIKTYGAQPRLDVGVLTSDRPATVAGLFTQNKVCGAPVTVSRERVTGGVAQALVVNSGCSNVAMGERGLLDARRMAELAANKVNVPPEHVLVGSTGVIGRPLPLERISTGLKQLTLQADGGAVFARAMMTTDTVPKSRAIRFEHEGRCYVVGGAAKGSGMAHPNMATVFCFLTTDAAVDKAWLDGALKRVGDRTINMVDVDMDTSTSDTMLMFANGAAGGPVLSGQGAELLESAMLKLATELARDLARDGEGASTLIEVEITGARSEQDARVAARTVVSSPLVKTMVAGRDPNLGRVLMAVGRSGAQVEVERLKVSLMGHVAFDRGQPTALEHSQISQEMNHPEVRITVDLGLGEHCATAWGCDMTEEYVRINADYTT